MSVKLYNICNLFPSVGSYHADTLESILQANSVKYDNIGKAYICEIIVRRT